MIVDNRVRDRCKFSHSGVFIAFGYCWHSGSILHVGIDNCSLWIVRQGWKVNETSRLRIYGRHLLVLTDAHHDLVCKFTKFRTRLTLCSRYLTKYYLHLHPDIFCLITYSFSPLCWGCIDAGETASHVILKCVAVASQRSEILGTVMLLLEACEDTRKLICFWAEFGWLH